MGGQAGPMNEPMTEAGRRLWREVADRLPSNAMLHEGILAIEAEAREQGYVDGREDGRIDASVENNEEACADLAARIEALQPEPTAKDDSHGDGYWWAGHEEMRRAVLAAIREEATK